MPYRRIVVRRRGKRKEEGGRKSAVTKTKIFSGTFGAAAKVVGRDWGSAHGTRTLQKSGCKNRGGCLPGVESQRCITKPETKQRRAEKVVQKKRREADIPPHGARGNDLCRKNHLGRGKAGRVPRWEKKDRKRDHLHAKRLHARVQANAVPDARIHPTA